MDTIDAVVAGYISQCKEQINAESKKKQPNEHLIAVLSMHINMAKDKAYTKKYGLVTDDVHGEFAMAWLLGYY
jgi:hypothetical protein